MCSSIYSFSENQALKDSREDDLDPFVKAESSGLQDYIPPGGGQAKKDRCRSKVEVCYSHQATAWQLGVRSKLFVRAP